MHLELRESSYFRKHIISYWNFCVLLRIAAVLKHIIYVLFLYRHNSQKRSSCSYMYYF